MTYALVQRQTTSMYTRKGHDKINSTLFLARIINSIYTSKCLLTSADSTCMYFRALQYYRASEHIHSTLPVSLLHIRVSKERPKRATNLHTGVVSEEHKIHVKGYRLLSGLCVYFDRCVLIVCNHTSHIITFTVYYIYSYIRVHIYIMPKSYCAEDIVHVHVVCTVFDIDHNKHY